MPGSPLDYLNPSTYMTRRQLRLGYDRFLQYLLHLTMYHYPIMPIPVGVRSEEEVCGSSTAGIAGSNPDDSMDIRIL
jgi:hypothetical protein